MTRIYCKVLQAQKDIETMTSCLNLRYLFFMNAFIITKKSYKWWFYDDVTQPGSSLLGSKEYLCCIHDTAKMMVEICKHQLPVAVLKQVLYRTMVHLERNSFFFLMNLVPVAF